MPRCMTCREMVPPDVCELIQPGDLHKCKFCIEGSNMVSINMVLLNKQEVMHDYKELLGKLKDSQNLKGKLRDITVEGAVKKLGKLVH